MNAIEPGLPARQRRSFKLPADTAAGCRDRAAADLLASVAMSTVNARQRLETSAASWAARADLLQRDEDEFEARRNASRANVDLDSRTRDQSTESERT